LGLDDWLVLTFDAEVDLVGPIAAGLMQRRGLPYPYNLHLQAPLVDNARGGSFITGLGGDEAFLPAARPFDVVLGSLPRRVRRRRIAKTDRLALPWLTPEANRTLGATWIDIASELPVRWDESAAVWWCSRYLQLTMAAIARLGDDNDVRIHHPFADASFVAALAKAGGRRGFQSRGAALAKLFGDLLPTEVPQRESKATFDEVLWNDYSSAFAAALVEDGLEQVLAGAALEEVVDAEALHVHWSGPRGSANSFLTLQACWLSARTPA
jgi:asparagine synthase (glutamine-hydrolysing)